MKLLSNNNITIDICTILNYEHVRNFEEAGIIPITYIRYPTRYKYTNGKLEKYSKIRLKTCENDNLEKYVLRIYDIVHQRYNGDVNTAIEKCEEFTGNRRDCPDNCLHRYRDYKILDIIKNCRNDQ